MSSIAKAAELAVPEVAVVKSAFDLVARRRKHSESEQLAVIQPPEREPLIKLGRDRIRVVTRKGVRIVDVKRAPGVTGAELLGLILIGGATYEAYQLAKSASSAGGSAPGWNGWIPNSKGWGFIGW